MRARLVWVPGYHSFPKWAIIGVNKIVRYTADFVIESGPLYRGSTVLSNLLPRAILNFFVYNLLVRWKFTRNLSAISSTCVLPDVIAQEYTPDNKKTNPLRMLLILHPTNFGFFPLLQRIVCWLAQGSPATICYLRIREEGKGVTSCWETKTYFQRKGPTKGEGVTNWFRPTTLDFKQS